MAKEIISTTRPTDEGEMLWLVHYESSYYDNDPRMPGTVPIDGHYFVLATNMAEAIKKAESKIKKDKRRSDRDAEKKVTASIVTMEDLVAARDCSKDGRMGWIVTTKHSPISLACEEDSRRYRLAVCLVPIEK